MVADRAVVVANKAEDDLKLLRSRCKSAPDLVRCQGAAGRSYGGNDTFHFLVYFESTMLTYM